MKRIEVTYGNIPLIKFESDEWKDDEFDIVGDEIIKYIKENKYDYYLIQNKSYLFGDTEVSPIIMVNREDYGGISGTLDVYIKDIMLDLMPNDEDDE
jgi:hypothetical protein